MPCCCLNAACRCLAAPQDIPALAAEIHQRLVRQNAMSARRLDVVYALMAMAAKSCESAAVSSKPSPGPLILTLGQLDNQSSHSNSHTSISDLSHQLTPKSL